MRLGQTNIAWMASMVRASLRDNARIRGVVTDQIARGESLNFLSCQWFCYGREGGPDRMFVGYW